MLSASLVSATPPLLEGVRSGSRRVRPLKRLSGLDSIQPIYFLPDDNLAEEVLIPCLSVAETFDCMVGYFSSRSFAELAPGLASFLAKPKRTLRLIVSPFLTQQDRQAIEEGTQPAARFIEDAMAQLLVSEEGIVRHTLRCLSYLIATDRLIIQIALMKDAQFHVKAWIVAQGDDQVAAHGSGNLTEAGLIRNYEQVTVSRSWLDDNQQRIVESLQHKFTSLWEGREPACRLYALPEAIRHSLLQAYPADRPPTEQDYLDLVRPNRQPELPRDNPQETLTARTYNDFSIPASLRYREGDYAHQGEAVDAWCANGFQGILEMATGSGKTISALVAAKQLHDQHKPLLIAIAAPYRPLIDQWAEQVRAFGITPVNLTQASGPRARRKLVANCHRRLRLGRSEVEVLLTTHAALSKPDFGEAVSSVSAKRLLIADEVHGLGSPRFVQDPPTYFDYRLGLSATPERQYDPEGTAQLTTFFGKVVFSFPLDKAIGVCLVPYDYYVHVVHLTEDELDRWHEITERIRKLSVRADAEDHQEYLEKLLRDRRLILETATEKLAALENLLDSIGARTLQYTLIYATDKAPRQLESVNAALRHRGVLFHQLTAEETADVRRMRGILKSFRSGAIRVLTAKRVLDEGVDVPEITTAFILASTTVERQWVQRRGRILRKTNAVHKPYARLHDFMVLPPTLDDAMDRDSSTIIRQELLRIQEFARLSRNAGKADGAASTVHPIVTRVFGSGTVGEQYGP